MLTLFDPSYDPSKAVSEAERAWRVPVGVASPLWGVFATAATAGMAYWWLSQWRQFTHLEAVLPIAAPGDVAAAPAAILEAEVKVMAPVTAAAVDAIEQVAETTADVAELAPAAVVEEITAEPVSAKPAPLAAPALEASAVEAEPVELKADAPAKPKAPPAKAKPAVANRAPRGRDGD